MYVFYSTWMIQKVEANLSSCKQIAVRKFRYRITFRTMAIPPRNDVLLSQWRRETPSYSFAIFIAVYQTRSFGPLPVWLRRRILPFCFLEFFNWQNLICSASFFGLPTVKNQIPFTWFSYWPPDSSVILRSNLLGIPASSLQPKLRRKALVPGWE